MIVTGLVVYDLLLMCLPLCIPKTSSSSGSAMINPQFIRKLDGLVLREFDGMIIWFVRQFVLKRADDHCDHVDGGDDVAVGLPHFFGPTLWILCFDRRPLQTLVTCASAAGWCHSSQKPTLRR